jgi:hypothetical protein
MQRIKRCQSSIVWALRGGPDHPLTHVTIRCRLDHAQVSRFPTAECCHIEQTSSDCFAKRYVPRPGSNRNENSQPLRLNRTIER